MPSPENELLAAIYSALSGDATLLASGIDPATGTARSLTGVYNKPAEDAVTPYVRITLTDSIPLNTEAYGFTDQPTERTISLLVNAISEYEPETLSIANRLQELLRNRQVATANFSGGTWVTDCAFYIDNQSFPNRLYNIAALRVRCNMEPS